jgi:thioredoxin-dependent peroxiredoxin
MKIATGIELKALKNLAVALLFVAALSTSRAALPPQVGGVAPNFTLNTLDGKAVELKQLTASNPMVLVVLRGWPGYQCPICDGQVHDFIASEAGFAKAKAQLVFVYPGPADDLKAHAEEFKTWKGREWPAEFLYILDPDYIMVNAYGLRWNARNETAYPSTFIIDTKGTVRFAHVSKSHGDRVSATTALEALRTLK